MIGDGVALGIDTCFLVDIWFGFLGEREREFLPQTFVGLCR